MSIALLFAVVGLLLLGCTALVLAAIGRLAGLLPAGERPTEYRGSGGRALPRRPAYARVMRRVIG
jgi:hypothetical protein